MSSPPSTPLVTLSLQDSPATTILFQNETPSDPSPPSPPPARKQTNLTRHTSLATRPSEDTAIQVEEIDSSLELTAIMLPKQMVLLESLFTTHKQANQVKETMIAQIIKQRQLSRQASRIYIIETDEPDVKAEAFWETVRIRSQGSITEETVKKTKRRRSVVDIFPQQIAAVVQRKDKSSFFQKFMHSIFAPDKEALSGAEMEEKALDGKKDKKKEKEREKEREKELEKERRQREKEEKEKAKRDKERKEKEEKERKKSGDKLGIQQEPESGTGLRRNHSFGGGGRRESPRMLSRKKNILKEIEQTQNDSLRIQNVVEKMVGDVHAVVKIGKMQERWRAMRRWVLTVLKSEAHPLGLRLAQYIRSFQSGHGSMIQLMIYDPEKKETAEFQQLQDKSREAIAELQFFLLSLHEFFLLAYPELDRYTDLKSCCYYSIEEGLFSKLFNSGFDFIVLQGREKDAILEEQRKNSKELKPSHLGIKCCQEKFNDLSFDAILPFQRAAAELRLLAKFVTATEKATVLVRLLMRICDCVTYHWGNSSKAKDNEVGSDDLLPMLVYCILKSKTKFLCSECLFITKFVAEADLMGEKGYALASFETALEYIVRTPIGEIGQNGQ